MAKDKVKVVTIDDFIAEVTGKSGSAKVVEALDKMLTEHPNAEFFVERKGIQYFKV